MRFNKKAQESTHMSYVAIMGIIIAIIAVVMIMSFVVRAGGSTASFTPAYARDISNIMENTISTPADISVVYKFSDFIVADYNNNKLSIAQGKTLTTNRVYIPNDVKVTMLNSQNATEFLLIHKVGKELILAPVGDYKNDNPNRIIIRNVTSNCGRDEVELSVSSDIAELKSLPTKFPPSTHALDMFITNKDFISDSPNVIVYYDDSLSQTALCRLEKELRLKLKVDPVYLKTTHDELLQNHNVVLSFSSFPFVEPKIEELILAVSGGEV